jgi:hypothetical protein
MLNISNIIKEYDVESGNIRYFLIINKEVKLEVVGNVDQLFNASKKEVKKEIDDFYIDNDEEEIDLG